MYMYVKVGLREKKHHMRFDTYTVSHPYSQCFDYLLIFQSQRAVKTNLQVKNCLIMRFDTVSLQYSQCFDYLLISVAASSEDKSTGEKLSYHEI